MKIGVDTAKSKRGVASGKFEDNFFEGEHRALQSLLQVHDTAQLQST